MTATKGFIYGAATTPLDTRKADASKLVTNADGSPRIGVVGPNPSIVTSDPSTAPMRVAVAGAGFATQRAANDGVAHWTNDGSIFLTVTKPASQSWITTVYVKHDDTQNGDADNLAVIGTVTGSAAAIPTEAAIPTGALKIATILIPSTATSTQSAGVVITNVYPMTALAGGVVPFRTLSELVAWTTARQNQQATVIADGTPGNNVTWTFDPTGWTPLVPQPVEAVRATTDQWAATTDTDMGLSLTITVPRQARYLVQVEFERMVPGNSAGSFGIKDSINGGTAADVIRVNDDNAANTLRNRFTASRILTLSAATHKFSLFATQGISGNKTVYAGSLIRATYISPA